MVLLKALALCSSIAGLAVTIPLVCVMQPY